MPPTPSDLREAWQLTARGGQGGRVIRVTSLAAHGPGSLREALEARGARLIVFEVGGVIDLEGASLEVHEPNVTLAGQTAPDPGVTLIRGGLRIETNAVIVEHVRLRPGETDHAKNSGWEVDGITVAGGLAYDVTIDHCSISWATDENLAVTGPRPTEWKPGRSSTPRRITFSNNIVAEGLSRSTHGKGEHSKGTLVHDGASEVAIVGNLYAHNRQRNPLFKGGASGLVANNLIYAPGDKAVHYALRADEWGAVPFSIGRLAVVGNVLKLGPDSEPSVPLLLIEGEGELELFSADNLVLDRPGRPSPGVVSDPLRLALLVDAPPCWPERFAALPSRDVFEGVLGSAGARPWNRDEVDRRIVEQARHGTGRMLDSESEGGGYPRTPPTRRPFVEADWDLETLRPK